MLTTIYGQKWTSLIVDEAMLEDMQKTWGHYLAGTDAQTIKQALDKLPTEYPEWPPTVGQFLQVCKIGKDPSMQPSLPKPAPERNEELAFEAFTQLRKILK